MLQSTESEFNNLLEYKDCVMNHQLSSERTDLDLNSNAVVKEELSVSRTFSVQAFTMNVGIKSNVLIIVGSFYVVQVL